MATFVEVVKFEGEAPPNTIRLVKSGEFYRAYNHSAWLFQQCIAEHKVMRKYVKQLGEDIYYIGFPEKSLIGNIGERHYQKTELGYDITLRPDELPIGNLTSQLFSNIYLNALDQYAKRTLRCKHYGRYVDDVFVVSHNRKKLHEMIGILFSAFSPITAVIACARRSSPTRLAWPIAVVSMAASSDSSRYSRPVSVGLAKFVQPVP